MESKSPLFYGILYIAFVLTLVIFSARTFAAPQQGDPRMAPNALSHGADFLDLNPPADDGAALSSSIARENAAVTAANQFATTYNAWAAGHRAYITSAQDVKMWKEVRRAWRTVDSRMKEIGY